MTASIPASHKDLLESKALASLATIMPDGSPQVTPVWFDFDGSHVRLNSVKGRQKDRNIRRSPNVALAIVDPGNLYRYLEIRGRVVEITEEGGDAHIDSLAKKYLGVDRYPNHREGDVRVIYRVAPERFSSMG
ncbi:MAG: PPOX class F420-dependent oxidoreductase [Gammaproteobacteria bacterium]|nr:PPOX class F420-dependent oxidoreductase [Gammaproteobacteria bacterium]